MDINQVLSGLLVSLSLAIAALLLCAAALRLLFLIWNLSPSTVMRRVIRKESPWERLRSPTWPSARDPMRRPAFEDALARLDGPIRESADGDDESADNDDNSPDKKEGPATTNLGDGGQCTDHPGWERYHLTARTIKSHLDTRVVGQDTAKIQLSVLLSMHLGWFRQQNRMHRSPNAILVGPTGVGKTHTMRVASEFLRLPFVAVDATSLVPAGVVGLQVEDVLADLVMIANDILEQDHCPRVKNDDIELARRGVIFIDEFDKLAVRPELGGDTAQTVRLVQRRLLKLAEGATLGIGVRYHQGDSGAARTIDTSGILVIASGAFADIDSPNIRRQRDYKMSRALTEPSAVVSADMVAYGLLPELVARFPVIIRYGPLNAADLEGIIRSPDISPIQVWINHFDLMGKQLRVTDDAIEYAAQSALALNMGARGLQQVLFPHLAKTAYEFESGDEDTYELDAMQLGKKMSLLDAPMEEPDGRTDSG